MWLQILPIQIMSLSLRAKNSRVCMILQCESLNSVLQRVYKSCSVMTCGQQNRKRQWQVLYIACCFVLPEKQYSHETKETLTRPGKGYNRKINNNKKIKKKKEREADVWLINVNSLLYRNCKNYDDAGRKCSKPILDVNKVVITNAKTSSQ